MSASAPPRFATERTDRPSFGPKVAEVARLLGVELLRWQQSVVDVALEHDDDGKLVYRDVILSVPRQCGKTTLVMALLVWRMLASEGQEIVYGAQSRLSARTKLLDHWWPQICRSSLAPMFSVGRATGLESLRCVNGSMLTLLSTEESSIHGASLDTAVADECWALAPAVEEALRPAMSARRQGQLLTTSTAGTPRSTWWRSRVDKGREAVAAGADSGLCYFEWSAPDDADPHDPAVWAAANPAIGATIDIATIAADHRAMPLPGFRRSVLNQWSDDLDDAGWRIVDRDTWLAARL